MSWKFAFSMMILGVINVAAMAAEPLSQPASQATTRPEAKPTVFTHLYTTGIRERGNTSSPVTGYEMPGKPPGGNPDWWRQELENIVTARVDVISLIGGEVVRSNQYDRFAVMLDVMAERAKAGKPNPQVCMFYDGIGYNRMGRLDLDSPEGIDEFYKWLKRFYDFFITERKAENVLFASNGAFPVFVYHPEVRGRTTAMRNKLVPAVKERFAKDFPGRKVYLVFSDLFRNGVYGNNRLAITNADNYFNWGAALGGIASPAAGQEFQITTIGPGFDETARRFREEGWGARVRDRRDGQTFRREFNRAIRIRDRAPWLILETWNFFTEGTSICASKTHGDKYMQISREMVPAFKQPMTGAERQTRDAWKPDGSNKIVGAGQKDALLDADDFIQDWLVLGPIPLPAEQQTDEGAIAAVKAETLKGEGGFRPSIDLEVAGLRWRAYENPVQVVPERIDLGPVLGEKDFSIAYLATKIIADEDGTYNLLVGADDLERVFVNAQPVLAYDTKARGMTEDQDVAKGVKLQKGPNWIVIKVVNIRGNWGAVVRFTTPDGRPVKLQP